MMDNDKSTSCPNCKKIVLSVAKTNFENDKTRPKWIQKIFDWHEQGIISQKELQNSINYLVSKGIISEKISNRSFEGSVSLLPFLTDQCFLTLLQPL